MRVNNQNVGNSVQGSDLNSTRKTEQSGKTGNAKESGRAKASPAVDTSGSASAEISGRAREMAQAKEAATSAPDLREEKIAELKRRIAAKQYNVKPEDVAEKMMSEHLRTRDID